MIMPSGAHVELRRVGDSNVYEATDSSYLQLLDGGNGSLLVRSTDGTQLAYWSINNAYRCSEIKDRNGNYLTIKYDPINNVTNLGRMTSIIDTLGRTINFNYDANYRLQSITQMRNGQTHVWASFAYGNLLVQADFVMALGEGENSGPQIVGLPANSTVSVLTQVGLDDGSRYKFDYNNFGQVYQIRHHAADDHQLAYRAYDLQRQSGALSITDCPRFTERRDWVENWNNGNPAVTHYTTGFTSGGLQWSQATFPDNTSYREYTTTDYENWQRGLVMKTEVYSADNSSTPKKTTVTNWTQDLVNVPYPLNPRVSGAAISDSDGNTRLTTLDYAAFGLPSDVFEWGQVT